MNFPRDWTQNKLLNLKLIKFPNIWSFEPTFGKDASKRVEFVKIRTALKLHSSSSVIGFSLHTGPHLSSCIRQPARTNKSLLWRMRKNTIQHCHRIPFPCITRIFHDFSTPHIRTLETFSSINWFLWSFFYSFCIDQHLSTWESLLGGEYKVKVHLYLRELKCFGNKSCSKCNTFERRSSLSGEQWATHTVNIWHATTIFRTWGRVQRGRY